MAKLFQLDPTQPFTSYFGILITNTPADDEPVTSNVEGHPCYDVLLCTNREFRFSLAQLMKYSFSRLYPFLPTDVVWTRRKPQLEVLQKMLDDKKVQAAAANIVPAPGLVQAPDPVPEHALLASTSNHTPTGLMQDNNFFHDDPHNMPSPSPSSPESQGDNPDESFQHEDFNQDQPPQYNGPPQPVTQLGLPPTYPAANVNGDAAQMILEQIQYEHTQPAALNLTTERLLY